MLSVIIGSLLNSITWSESVATSVSLTVAYAVQAVDNESDAVSVSVIDSTLVQVVDNESVAVILSTSIGSLLNSITCSESVATSVSLTVAFAVHIVGDVSLDVTAVSDNALEVVQPVDIVSVAVDKLVSSLTGDPRVPFGSPVAVTAVSTGAEYVVQPVDNASDAATAASDSVVYTFHHDPVFTVSETAIVSVIVVVTNICPTDSVSVAVTAVSATATNEDSAPENESLTFKLSMRTGSLLNSITCSESDATSVSVTVS